MQFKSYIITTDDVDGIHGPFDYSTLVCAFVFVRWKVLNRKVFWYWRWPCAISLYVKIISGLTGRWLKTHYKTLMSYSTSLTIRRTKEKESGLRHEKAKQQIPWIGFVIQPCKIWNSLKKVSNEVQFSSNTWRKHRLWSEPFLPEFDGITTYLKT